MRIRGAPPAGMFGFVVPHAAGIGPVGLTKADAMRWRWRIAQWSVSIGVAGTLTYTSASGSQQLTLGLTATGACGWTPAISGFQENQLLDGVTICPGNTNPGGSLYPIITGSASTTDPTSTGGLVITGGIQFSIFSTSDFTGNQVPPGTVPPPPMSYDPLTQLFSPTIAISASIFVQGIATIIVNWPALASPLPDYLAAAPAATVTIDTHGFVTQALLENNAELLLPSQEPGISAGEDFTAQILAVPASYFPYTGQSDGISLYNADTGQPAINPATGFPFTPDQIAAAPFP